MQKIGDITDTADGNGEFTDGSVAGNVQPTELMAAWFTTVQREIIAVLTEAGIDPDKANDAQLNEAIKILMKREVDGSGFLLSKNNLSDLDSAEESRGHLGLKAAATKDVTNSRYDSTSGRVSQTGDYGWGVGDGSVMSLTSIYDIKCSGVYNALGKGASNPAEGMPDDSGNTRYAVLAASVYTNIYWVTLISNKEYYVGNVDVANKNSVWCRFYNTMSKPSASDVDAVSASQGGVFQKQVQLSQGLRLQNSEYLGGIAYGSDSASFSGANVLLKSWYGIGFYSTYPSSGELGIMGYINVRLGRLEMKEQIIPGNYTNFDSRYQEKGNYTPAGQAYTKAESDGRFQPKGNYTPAGQAYTKAESDGRFQKINTALKATNGWYKDTNTGIIIQFGSGGYTNGGRITFPTAFPNACLSVTGNDTGSGIVKVALGARNTTGFTMYSEQSNVSLNWIAVGY